MKRGRKCKGRGAGGGSNGCDKVNKCTYQHIPWRKGEGRGRGEEGEEVQRGRGRRGKQWL